MSFAILRHAKIKSTTKGAAVSHNHRLNPLEKININPALKHLNKAFMGDGAQARIDAKLPSKMRKDAVVSVEILLTASPEFFDGLEKDREKLAKNQMFLAWVDESLTWAKNEFGANLVDAVLHMDESSPHIHILSIPLTKDGRLCAKEITAKSEMQKRQTGYANSMERFGLKRGDPAIETKRRHIGLKETTGSGGHASQLAAQLAASQTELSKTQARLSQLNKISLGDVAKISELKKKVVEMDEYTEKLEADLVKSDEKIAAELVAKAEAIEALVQAGIKSDALLVTSNGHRDAAEKLRAKVETMKKEIVEKDARIEKYEAMAVEYEDFKKAGNAPALFVPGADPSKSLLERIQEWVKGLVEKFGSKPAKLVEGQEYSGNVLAVMDGAWAQRTNRDGSWVVHQGQAPALESFAEVKFRGGVSQVKGMDNQFQQQKPGVTR